MRYIRIEDNRLTQEQLLPRGRPLEGAPGWRVIERPRQSWRAGYVIVPLAVCAGFFLALAPLHPDWPSWPKDEMLEASRLVKAREAELLDAAKAELLETLEARKARSRWDVRQDTTDAGRLAPRPALLGRSVAHNSPTHDPGAEKAPLPTLRPWGQESASSAEDARSPAEPSIRVFIHHTMGAANAARAARLGAFLQSRGFTVAGIRSVDFQIDLPSVRYFFDRDRAGSRHLIDAVKEFATQAPAQAPDQLTDFTHFSPKPRRGNVEVWLASDATGWTRSARADPPS